MRSRLEAVAEDSAPVEISQEEKTQARTVVDGKVVPWPRPSVVEPPRPADEELLTSGGALIDGSDVADSPRDSARRHLLALADMAGIVAAYLAVWTVHPPSGGELLDRLPLLAVLPLWVVLNKLLGLYDRDDKLIHKSTLDELPGLIHSLTIGTLLVFTFGGALMPVETQRAPAAMFWLMACFSVPVMRAMARTWVRVRFAPERCLIVGSGSVAEVLARKLAGHPEYGMELVGFIDGERGLKRRPPATPIPMLGDVAHFTDICREHGIERVIVGFSSASNDETLDIVRAAKRAQIKITIVPRLFEVIGHSVVVDEVEGMTVLSLRGLSRARSSLMIKRAIDVCGAGLGMLVIAPVLLAIALAVKLDSRGPVLFAQRRMGRNKDFRMLKFRTMVVGADQMKQDLLHLNEADGPMFKIERDPRITRVGRFLRKTSLDELPQLWNVLRGEMSLVGPRPLIPDEDDHVIGWHRTRLELTPGLTGPWQVAGRTAVPFHEMVKMDYLYVAEWSLWNDIRLLLRTMPVVLMGRGA
jgi:exopolysaccharide biosynthesis polyprenyl glycosylphosphotransferase